MSKIVVFGARGNIGSHVVNTLNAHPSADLRLISSHEEGVSELANLYPNAEVVQGNLDDANSIRRVIKGAERVFVMYPDFEFDEEASTKRFIEAVREEGSIKQVVRLLGVIPIVSEQDIPMSFRQQPAMPCWVHFRGRQLWQESGLPVTFVNPWAWYMQSLPWLVGQGIVEEAVLCMPHSHTLPYIDTRDVSEVIAAVLSRDPSEFVGLELGLTGHQEDCFDFAEIAEFMTQHLGREISYSGSIAKFETLLGEGADPLLKYVGWEKSMVEEYRMHTETVKEILGKEPRRFKNWISENRHLLTP
jgi:uncharacterized protein YbjT (DUF2867 family)